MPKSGCMNAILSFALVSDINNFSPFNRKRVTYKPVQQFAFEIQYNSRFLQPIKNFLGHPNF